MGNKQIQSIKYKIVRIVFSNGDVYKGELVNKLINGKGTYTWHTGNVYKGQWKDSKRYGKGKMIYSNGDIYEGWWKNDKKHGNGKYTYYNGDIYEGRWENDKRCKEESEEEISHNNDTLLVREEKLRYDGYERMED
uniref:MORN repeat protein n=1 Tax=Mimivirus LCMiAC02 TaxID=2506609 RepID=A0A4P6VQ89_9VIRU|nr:MAG: MORN repeat protein [Mimivirus LCMiAC02]